MSNYDGQNLIYPYGDREFLRLTEPITRKVDAARPSDRCLVGQQACNNSVIQAHHIARAQLKLIADGQSLVYGSYHLPPIGPAEDHLRLNYRPSKSFGTAGWACGTHDTIFTPIDSTDINVYAESNIGLLIYRETLRMLHVTEWSLARYKALETNPEINEGNRTFNLTPPALVGIIRGLYEALDWLGPIKRELDAALKTMDFSNIVYRVDTWQAEPAIAASGMTRLPGPRLRSEKSQGLGGVPAWVISLPQSNGQVVIAATLRGFEEYAKYVLDGMPENQWDRKSYGANRMRLLSANVLEHALDFAMSPAAYAALKRREQIKLNQHWSGRRNRWSRFFFNHRKQPSRPRKGVPDLFTPFLWAERHALALAA